MSKTTDGIKLIQDDFRERFGVEVKIRLHVHPTFDNAVTRETADGTTKQFAEEWARKHAKHDGSS